MRRIVIVMAGFFIVGQTSNAQDPNHLAYPEHGHTPSGYGVCWGYAMGRSAGKDVNSICNPATMVPKGQETNSGAWEYWTVDGLAWDQFSNGISTDIEQGDIVRFGSDHSAYVSGVSESGGVITRIYIAEILAVGQEPNTTLLSTRQEVEARSIIDIQFTKSTSTAIIVAQRTGQSGF